jgi:DNA-binding MarR family transcriptional regulator
MRAVRSKPGFITILPDWTWGSPKLTNEPNTELNTTVGQTTVGQTTVGQTIVGQTTVEPPSNAPAVAFDIASRAGVHVTILLQSATNVSTTKGDASVAERQGPDYARRRVGQAPPRARERLRRRRQSLDLGVLEGHLGYFVRRLQVWVFHDFVRSLASLDIRPAQYAVLVVIEANSGLSQADVAERLGIERARLVRLLDGLERRGLIRRRASPHDRRSHALVLTRRGQGELKRMKPLAAAHEANLARRLGPAKRASLLASLRDFA